MLDTIPKKAFSFLKELEQNNNREWFNDNKPTFKTLETEVKQVYNHLFDLLNTHDDIDKVKVFRIYRDVRFSKNKVPYKTHFSGSFNRVKPKLRGGYFVRIEPNNQSFIATGFWEPNKEDLLRIRKEFEMDDHEIRAIFEEKTFKNTWGNLQGDALKTAPRGFDKTHPAIDLIRQKQFIFFKKYTDKEVLSSNFIKDVNTSFKAIRPFFDYMSSVLTTDLNGESLI